MKTYDFHSLKYGPELLIDVARIENTPKYDLSREPHAVSFYEILFLEQASGTLTLDNHKFPLQNGMVIYLSPYQRRIWDIEVGSLRGYFISWARDFMELFFSDPLFAFRLSFFYNNHVEPFLLESEVAMRYHIELFDRIRSEFNALQSDSADFIRAYLLLVLAGQNRRYSQEHALSPERHKNTEAYEFKKLVETHIRDFQTVDEFASRMKVSRITLNKKVKAQFGMTATQFIKNRLLTEVKRELLFSSKSISEIAYELNFSEPSSMARFFSNMIGQRPTEFRARYRKPG